MRSMNTIAATILLLVAQNSISQEVKLSEADGKDLLSRWNQCHNEHNANCFSSLFSNSALFYSKLSSTADIIDLKASLFEKHSTFSQTIDDNTVSYHHFGDTLAIHFVKEVETISGKKKYPSYLLIQSYGESYKIVAESDDITDKNLGVPRSWTVESASIARDSIATTSPPTEPRASKQAQTSDKTNKIQDDPRVGNSSSTLEFTWKRFFIFSIPLFITIALFIQKIVGIRTQDNESDNGLTSVQKYIWGTALLGGCMVVLASVFVDYAIAFLAIALIQYVILLHGYSNKCKECSTWWAAKLVNIEVVERWQEMKTIQRVVKTKDRSGNVVSTQNRHEQIVVDCQKFRKDFQCKQCGHKWAEVETKKSDTMLNSIGRRFGS